jgi:hypothetical protein
MPDNLWDHIHGGLVVSIVGPGLVFLGFGALSMTPPSVKFAIGCFSFGYLIILAKVGWWVTFQRHETDWQKSLFVAGLFAVCGFLWFASCTFAKSLAAPIEAETYKVDKFATVVPFNPANKNVPVPMNINNNDPKARFYGDLLRLTGRPEKQQDGTPWPAERDFAQEDARTVFIGRLLQFYVFSSIDELQRDSEGIEWTLEKGSRPLVRVGIVPPDRTAYPTNVLLEELSKSEFLSAGERMMREHLRPFSIPKYAKMSLIEYPSSPATGVAQYIVRLERKDHFLIDFKVTPTLGPVTVSGVTGASVPRGFQPAPGEVSTVVGYPFIVTMTYEIHRTDDQQFMADDYAKWAESLFAALKQRMGAD